MAKHRANSFLQGAKEKNMHILDIIPECGSSGVQSPSEERGGDINKANCLVFCFFVFCPKGVQSEICFGTVGVGATV